MRLSFAIATAVLALSAPASATDFGAGGYAAYGERAGQIVIYDYYPGVRVRAYWRAPWRNRHYFPTTGIIPESGRHENLNAPRLRYEPARSYYREWSTSSVFELPVADFARSVLPTAAPLAEFSEPVDPKSPQPRRFEPLPPAQK